MAVKGYTVRTRQSGDRMPSLDIRRESREAEGSSVTPAISFETGPRCNEANVDNDKKRCLTSARRRSPTLTVLGLVHAVWLDLGYSP